MNPDRRRFLISSAVAGGTLAVGLGGCHDQAPIDRPVPPPIPGAVPDPLGTLVTRWGADPWTRGAWTSVRPGAGGDPRAELARPLADRVFFAGEATSADAPGTLQGAYVDGQRAADAVSARLPPSARLVVIGAGLAGLAAARRWDDRLGLAATVLEGRDRVGGRILTNRTLGPGLVVEQGAPWVYGRPSPVLDLADRFKLAHRPVASEPRATRADGTAADPTIVRAATTASRELQDLFAAQALLLPPTAALADALDPALIELQRRHPGLDPVTLQYVQLDVQTAWLQPQAADAPALSVRAVPPATTPRAVLPGGLDQLTAILAQDMDVRLSRPAIAIDWSADGIAVQTNAGPILADAVIVTTPVGVLRTGQPSFTPALPPATQAAIAQLDPGRYEQCYLRFTHRFWGDAKVIDIPGDPTGAWSRWYDAPNAAGAPVLLGVNAGAATVGLDRLADDRVVADALAALRRGYR